MADKVRKGRHPRGEKSVLAKFTNEAVKQIRLNYKRGDAKRIAALAGVRPESINRIVRGERYV
jgi:uncharacterized protein with GYD domain